MTNIVGATSLFFISLEGTYKAMGFDQRNTETPQFTDHCFTGDYPIKVKDLLKVRLLMRNNYYLNTSIMYQEGVCVWDVVTI